MKLGFLVFGLVVIFSGTKANAMGQMMVKIVDSETVVASTGKKVKDTEYLGMCYIKRKLSLDGGASANDCSLASEGKRWAFKGFVNADHINDDKAIKNINGKCTYMIENADKKLSAGPIEVHTNLLGCALVHTYLIPSTRKTESILTVLFETK